MAENYITTALKKLTPLFLSKKQYLVEQGGTSGGKTYPTLMLITSWLQAHSDKLWTVVGIDYRHLRDGAIRDFKNIMKNAEIWEPERWSSTEKTYTFGNGSQLQFLSVDTMGAHGSRRDGLFVNEANAISYQTFDQLATRTREKVIIDYNPSAEFWAHTELLKKHREDCDFIILTYKDNEALSERERANIERHKPKQGEEPSNWWVVYGLGQIGSLEGNVYSGWRKATDDDYKKAKLTITRKPSSFATASTLASATTKLHSWAFGAKNQANSSHKNSFTRRTFSAHNMAMNCAGQALTLPF